MKTSIFDMSFTLPPMLEMTEVGKDKPNVVVSWLVGGPFLCV
ncbi:MAG: hypothetical protein ACJ0SM_06045 [Arenicellales bacterium]